MKESHKKGNIFCSTRLDPTMADVDELISAWSSRRKSWFFVNVFVLFKVFLRAFD